MESNKVKSKEEYYTKLAKEGRFIELPDTCEFFEAVWLEVCDNEGDDYTPLTEIIGKFKGRFIDITFSDWKIAKTPAVKTVVFPLGSIVEVVTAKHTYYGMIEEKREKSITITMGGNSGATLIPLDHITIITKLK